LIGRRDQGDPVKRLAPRTTSHPVKGYSSALRPADPGRNTSIVRAALLGLLVVSSAPSFSTQTVGTLGDLRVYPDRVPDGATRVYYLDDEWADPTDSLATNALGNDQVLFYDIHPPTSSPHAQATILYIHGGGYTVGGASYGDTVDAIEQLTALGFWTISLEYRRGWYNEGIGGVVQGDHPITPEEVILAEDAFALALDDVLAAWQHVAEKGTGSFPYPDRYILIGESAGGSLVSRAALIERPADREILGAVIGFGTHRSTDSIAAPTEDLPPFPIVIQGGVFDDFQPLYDGPLYFQDIMPESKGLHRLTAELNEIGYPTRLLLSAQSGHGFGAYEVCESDRCLDCPLDADGNPTFGDDCGRLGTVTHYPEALQFFEDVYYGASAATWTEYLFKCPDGYDPTIAPGDVIDTLSRPGFRYEPYESELETGAVPDALLTHFAVSNC